ncbi:hypothetical protein [Enterococcus mundtii]|uniref:hypothetical protein n=1 Tax=Enterococcus mundtii TaxID=53346 RepID=UPI000D355B9D|nr:hypothetical protein [Enterococcus mundtii]MDB7102394.1 hypothetical protein [Enterococcus mundtii]PTO38320.1 hypothetical protein C6P52_09595 [Enterococcus mundtii]PTO43036.1 hypothetical protein C6P54_10925 [Enterococcus mundtii]
MDSEKDILLYGLYKKREAFFADVKNNKVDLQGYPTLSGESEHAHIIDYYNNRLHMAIVERKRSGRLRTFKQWRLFIDQLLFVLFRFWNEYPLWKQYLQCMNWNPKNSLWATFNYPIFHENLRLEGIVLYFQNEEGEIISCNKHITRGCKNGIDMAMYYPNILIYFVLDGIKMKEVMQKNRQKKYKSEYTCKELRYIFRHWYQLKEKVVFFLNRKIVKAPWIEGNHIRQWERYHEHRKEKLMKETSKSVDDLTHDAFPEEKKNELKSFKAVILEVNEKGKIQKKMAKSIGRQRAFTL